MLVAALAACLPAGRAPGAGEFGTVSWRELSDRELTPLGARVLKAGRRWTHAESEHFVFHAAPQVEMELLVHEAEYAYRKAGALVGDIPAPRKGHMFFVSDPKVWKRIQARADPSKYGQAMQLANDIFIFRRSGELANVLQIPHEVVHFRIWQGYGKDLPIWLDEGLASYAGWEIARSYYAEMGKPLARTPPAARPEHLVTLDVLTAQEEYPAMSDGGATYYRQVEELVRLIAERIGKDRLPEFVKYVALDGCDWRTALRDRLGFAESDFAGMEEEVRMRVLATPE